MESKIKIKMGPIEIEYEGSEGFIKEKLPALLAAVFDFYKKSGVSDSVEHVAAAPATASSNTPIQATTGSIAAQLGVKSGTDLIMAAAARLAFSLGIGSFSRSQILEEMKSASSYYKKTYMSNLTKYLNQLVKDGKLLETAKDTYALSASAKSSMEAKLA